MKTKKFVGILLTAAAAAALALSACAVTACGEDDPPPSPDPAPEIITSVWDGSTPSSAPSSYEVSGNDIVIRDAAAFAWFAAQSETDDFEGKKVTLAANIDLNGKEWSPVAPGARDGSSFDETSCPFKGSFDGAGLTISGLSITSAATEELGSAAADRALGLFGVVAGGTVGNFKLTEVSINVPDNECVGSAVGLLTDGGSVTNVSVGGSLTAKNGNGGVVGRLTESGSITDCSNSAEVTATGNGGNTAGIVGAAYYTRENEEMNITGCSNVGKISGGTGVGGIVGLSAANVKNCSNDGEISGNNTSVGGNIGEQRNYGEVSGNVNTADVTNTNDGAFGTGGIIGWIRYFNDPTAYAVSETVAVTDNDNSGKISGGASAGGIVGHIYNRAVVSGNTNTAAAVSAKTFAAGIAGSLQLESNNMFADEEADIDVTGNVSTTPVGSITADCADQFAYNNDKTHFTVENNGDKA